MYRAITDRIIVQLSDYPQSSAIMVPLRATHIMGTVLAVGNKVYDVHKGDEIIFHVFDELPLPEKNLVVIREKSVLGIIRKTQ